MKRLPLVAGLLLLLLALLFSVGSHPEREGAGAGSGKSASAPERPEVSPEARRWIAELGSRVDEPGKLAAAIEQATVRRARMLEWMEHDPERALEAALGWGEYAALPEELRPYFERPFSATATLRVLPVCDAPGHEPGRVLEMDGQSWEASVHGRRIGQMTKEDAPLTGITLEGRAVVAAESLRRLEENAETLAGFPFGQADPARDFATGEAIAGSPVVAVAGGRRYHFRDAAALEETNARLARLDARPGPANGARVVLEMADGDGGIDWQEAEEFVNEQASTWTETPKDVLCIRVDFSDLPGEVVSQAAMAAVLNTTVSDSIEEMSYGKTWIDATVSATTVRMPQPSTAYLPNDNNLLHNEAKDAYEAIHGEGSTGGYDIVVVHFPWIGIQSSGGLTYSGLAGGSRQWLQGTSSSNTIIHEFGHNYGLPHASFWATTDGSSVGVGANNEYGDITDIMGSGPDPEGHFHPHGKVHLNWLESDQWADASVSGSGVYRIHRFDDPATTQSLRGVRVTKGTEPDEYYWLGFRAGMSDEPLFQQGAYLLWQRPNYASHSWLVDATPGSIGGRSDAPIAIGTTYSDTVADVHFTPLALGGAGADQWLEVNVQIGPFPGNGDPTGSIAGPSTASARMPVSFSASVSDPDSDPLIYSWDFGDGSTLESGAAADHAWTAGGSYTVRLTVSDMKGGRLELTKSVTVSDPLETWTSGNVGNSDSIDRVAYLDGRFLVGGDNAISCSFDGTSWTTADLGINKRCGGFAWGDGRFVMVGRDWDGSQWIGAVFHSPDGCRWTQAAIPSGPPLRDVSYGNGGFVAVGDEGRVLHSADGETWSMESTPQPVDLESIAFGGGGFVAVGDQEVFTSADGTGWSDHSAALDIESWQSLNHVVYVGGRFVAAGWYTDLQVSDDGGQTWTRCQVVGGHDYDIDRLAVGEGVVIGLAYDKDEDNATTLLVSTDGAEWFESPGSALPMTSSTGLGAAAYGDGNFLIAYGNTGDLLTSGAFHPGNAAPLASISGPSTMDARDQALFSATATDADGDPLTLVWDFKDGSPLVRGAAAAHVFPVGGSYSVDLIATDQRGGVTVETHAVTVNDPLESWAMRTSGTTTDLTDICLGSGTLVATGDGGNGLILRSTDAITWTPTTNGTNVYLEAVAFADGLFVAVGQDYDFGIPAWVGHILTSPDGAVWTERLSSGGPLRGVAHGGGVWVATGNGGTVWRSTDGINWNPAPSGTSEGLREVAYGDGWFVTGSFDGSVFRSSNGTSWNDVTAGAGHNSGWQSVRVFDFLGDRFLASGWYSRIRHSTDGGASFSTTETASRNIEAFAHGNGLWFATGIDKSNADADIHLISTDGENWSPLTTPSQPDCSGAVFFENTIVTVGDGGSVRQSAAFSAPQETGYDTWRALTFPGLPPLSAAEEDYDGDGLANLAEYATGTDPKDASDFATATTEWMDGALHITLPKSPLATDAIASAAFSIDLVSWSAAGITVIENSTTALVIRIDAPAPPRGFVRPAFSLGG